MLNFLNTAVLALAVTALFPFLLHLFSKRKVKVIPFSSIAYLKAMQKRHVRAIKIRQLLLLIIRTLVILAVVVAFARPATRGGYLGSHASVSAVILIDNSASMGLSVKDGRLYDLAVKKAEGILSQMGQSDETAIMTTSGDFTRSQGENLFGNPAAARVVLNKTSLSNGRADLVESFNMAASVLAERLNLNREIYVISDFQENSFDPEKTLQKDDAKIFLADLPGGRIDNVGIIEVDFGNQLIEVGTEFTVTATIKRRSGVEDETLASLYLDDKRIAQQDLRLGSSESVSTPFNVMVNDPGFHSGYVTLSDDDLLADNMYYFSFYIPERFTILTVGEERLDTRLFRLSLAPEKNLRSHWTVQQVTYEEFASVNLNQYDVLIMVDYSTLPQGDVARIREYVKKGGGLLLNLGQASDSAHYSRYFAEITDVNLVSSFPRQFSRSGYYLMTDFDLEHQILSVFKGTDQESRFDFKSFALIRCALADDSQARILARWSDGSPAVTVSSFGRGRVMFFNGDISPDISDIPLHPFFVPFMVRSTEFLSSRFSSHTESITSGSSPTRVLRGGFNVGNNYILTMPDGHRRIVAGEFRDNMRTVDCGRLDRSGVYSIWNGMRESDRFAVNIAPEEGDLYRKDWNELADRFQDAEKMPYSVDLAGFITERRFGRELWQYFLACVLILLVLEMYIARDRGAALPSDE
jgi:hypothetical protein